MNSRIAELLNVSEPMAEKLALAYPTTRFFSNDGKNAAEQVEHRQTAATTG